MEEDREHCPYCLNDGLEIKNCECKEFPCEDCDEEDFILDDTEPCDSCSRRLAYRDALRFSKKLENLSEEDILK